MNIEALAGIIIPLAFFAVVGGLIALKMLKPYGDRILELIKEIQKDRHAALSETRDLQQVHDRLDMLAERQEFLEALVKNRLDAEELPEGSDAARLSASGPERDEGGGAAGSRPSGGSASGSARGG
jgi:hypothetical protein